ncbi:MAG: hypothetical protein IAG13_10030 [Deltaproteobacteria bacterium]|nr:hypothetical protein [Nannocystaceae bacterium]
MVRFSSLALALFGGALAAASCYSERPAPPSFRYACEGPGDCRSNETCIDNLCQVECTQATAAEVCTASDHLLCFNGICTSGCIEADEHCPSSQECIGVAQFGLDFSSGGGGFFSSGASPDGLCGTLCDADDPDSCPSGESCLVGFCVAACETSATCATGLVCAGGLCIPEGAATTGGESGIPGTFSASITMTDGSGSSGDDGSTGGASLTTTADGGATVTDGTATTGGVQ